jgi:hypothetical protein
VNDDARVARNPETVEYVHAKVQQAAKHLAARSIYNPFKDFGTQAIAGQDQ